MQRLTPRDLLDLTPDLIGALSRDDLERTTHLVIELALYQANRLGRNSDNSSQPPSKNNPYQKKGPQDSASQERETNSGAGVVPGATGVVVANANVEGAAGR